MGLISVLLGFVWMPLAFAAALVPRGLIAYVLLTVHALAKIPYHALYYTNPFLKYWLVYFYILFGAAYFCKPKARRKYAVAAVLAALSLAATVKLGRLYYARGALNIVAVNVGQGAGTIMASGGQFALMDCGSGNSWLGAGSDTADQLLTMTLRAKIDLASGNFNMRDPVIYRINHTHHHRQGDKWCIYPMYDFAHPIQDALEGVTHSLCSLEYEDHRPLYNWVIEHTDLPSRPRQIEFARLGIDHTVMREALPANVKVGRTGLRGGWGSSAFFRKHLLENRRSRKFILPANSLLFAVITVIFCVFTKDAGLLPTFCMRNTVWCRSHTAFSRSLGERSG